MDIFLVVKVTDVNNNPLKKCNINVDFGGTGPGMGNQTAQPAGPDGTFEVKVPDAADIVSVTVERPPSFLPANQHVKIVRPAAGKVCTRRLKTHVAAGTEPCSHTRLQHKVAACEIGLSGQGRPRRDR